MKRTHPEPATRLEDAARELGLSLSTVSRAISGKGRVSERTRARVMNYIRKTGYRPNMIARGLAHSRSYNLCALLPEDAFASRAVFFQECLMGICSGASPRDYDVIVAVYRAGETGQLARLTRAEKADGYILMRAVEDDPAICELRLSRRPFVLIGSCDDPAVPQVDVDNFGQCRELAREVFAGGSARPAALLGDLRVTANRSRREGLLAAAREARIPAEDILFFDNLDTDEAVARAVDQCRGRVDCVFCGDGSICARVLERLGDAAAELPVASFCGGDFPGPAAVRAVDPQARRLGRTAAEKLLDLIG